MNTEWNKDIFKALPNDLWLTIYKFLQAIDLLPLRLSCKTFNELASNKRIWEELLIQERISFSSTDNLITKYLSNYCYPLRIFTKSKELTVKNIKIASRMRPIFVGDKVVLFDSRAHQSQQNPVYVLDSNSLDSTDLWLEELPDQDQLLITKREGNGRYVVSFIDIYGHRTIGVYEINGLEGPISAVSISLKSTHEMQRRPQIFKSASSQVSWIGNTMYYFDSNFLESLDVSTFQHKFIALTDPTFVSGITTHRNSLFFQLNEYIMELDAQNLEVKRKIFVGPSERTELVLWNDDILVLREDNLRVFKLKGNEIELMSNKEIVSNEFPLCAVMDLENILIATPKGFIVYKKTNWEEIWSLEVEVDSFSVVPTYFVDLNGRLWYADIADREWSVCILK